MTLMMGITPKVYAGVGDGFPVVAPAIRVFIPDNVLERAPTGVTVFVSGPERGDLVTLKIDGVDVWSGEMGLGQLGPITLPVEIDPAAPPRTDGLPVYYAKGTHTITASVSGLSDGSATFELAAEPSAYPFTVGEDVDPIYVPDSGAGPVRKWVMQDLQPGGLGSWVMPFNPRTMGALPIEKTNLTATATTSPEGQFHVTDAVEQPHNWTFAGRSATKAISDKLRSYAALNRRWYLHDHRGRAWTVTIIGLELEPKRREYDDVDADQVHNYTVQALIYSADWKTPV